MRQCKVCALLNIRHETCYYCEDCSEESGTIWLCNTVRRQDVGNTHTCWNLWHSFWFNGTRIPKEVNGKIRRRRQVYDPNEEKSAELPPDQDQASPVEAPPDQDQASPVEAPPDQATPESFQSLLADASASLIDYDEYDEDSDSQSLEY